MKKTLLSLPLAILCFFALGSSIAWAAPAPVLTAADIGTSDIAPTSVTLWGGPESGVPITAAGFSYGLTSLYGGPGSPLVVPSGSIATLNGVFSHAISGLACNTTYHYQAYATNAGGTTTTGDKTFKTEACGGAPISVTTVGSASVTQTTATLSGTLNSIGGDTGTLTVGFDYGTGGSLATIASAGNLTAPAPFSASLSGLTCGTSYSYEAYTSDFPFGVVASGLTLSFTTLPCPPMVVTNPVVGTPTTTSAVVSGTVTSTGGAASTTPGFTVSGGSLGAIAPATITVSGTTFTATVSGLTCSQSYTYTAKATNSAGAAAGATLSFSTATCPPTLPTVITDPAVLGSGTAVFMYGTLTSLGGASSAAVAFDYGTSISYGSIVTAGTPGPSMTATGSFSAAPVLACGTFYHYRAKATNTAGTGYGGDMTFSTPACPVTLPAVTTVSSSSVTTSSAILNGSLNSTGAAPSVTVGFYYGTSPSYGTTVTVSPAMTTTGAFTMPISGLVCGTTYDYQAYGYNTAGTATGANMTFMTSACNPPIVVSLPATSVTTTSAVLNGNLTSMGSGGWTYFTPSSPVGTVALQFAFGTSPGGVGIPVGTATPHYSTTPTTFSVAVTGLTCGTSYEYNPGAVYMPSPTGAAVGATTTFTTLPCPPVLPAVTTVSSSSVTASSAVLTGSLTSTGGAATIIVGFNYGTTTSPYSSIATVSPAMTATGTFTMPVSGLACGTTYHYQAYGSNSAGTATGADMTFVTSACPMLPAVVTVSATSITTTAAVLNGSITSTLPNATTVGFGYNTIVTTTTGSDPSVSGPAGSYGPGPFTVNITGLACGTTYHFRAFATNTAGRGWGSDASFSTTPCPTGPTVITNAVVGTPTTTTAVLSGTVTNLGVGAASATPGFTIATGSVGTITPATITTAGTTFTATVTGLTCGQTYSYVATAANGTGTANGSPVSFMTAGCPIGPTVITTAVGTITANTAVINGQITGLGSAASATPGFTVSSGSIGTISPAAITTSGTTFTATLSGLTCGQSYTYTATASSSAGSATAPTSVTFPTPACPPGLPAVTTVSYSSVTSTSATLTGSLTSLGGTANASAAFDYGFSSSSYSWSAVATTPAQPMASTGTFSATVTGLACGDTYHFRAKATNTAGTGYGSDLSFMTSACAVGAPTVTTVSVGSITTSSAVLTGSINMFSGGPASAAFDYGTSPSYGAVGSPAVATAPVQPMNLTGSFTTTLTGLSCGQAYDFRARATTTATGGSTGYGANMSFSTTACPVGLPAVVTTPVGTITANTAVINGQITGLGATGISVNPGFNVSGGSLGTVTPAAVTTVGTAFTATLSSLSCGQSYTYTATASNSAGVAVAPASVTFSTAACPIGSPTVVTNAVVGTPTTTSAVLSGTVTATGGAVSTTPGFSIATGSVGTITPATITTSGSTFTATVTGLSCGQTYSYTATAMNSTGTASGSPVSFATAVCPSAPTVITNAVVGTPTTTTAVLSGTVTNLGVGAASATPGFTIATGSVGTITPATITTAGTTFTATVTGLTCGQTYSYVATAANGTGTANGSPVSFMTAGCPIGSPTVTTDAATGPTTTSATVNGTFTNLGTGATSGTPHFTVSGGALGTITPASITVSGTAFTATVTGLSCGQSYTFYAWGTNNAGLSAFGSVLPLATNACATVLTVTTDAATSVVYPNATLNGTITSLDSGYNAIARGFQYGTSSTTFGSTVTQSGSFGTGSFSAGITSLTNCVPVYWRAFATDPLGTVYGSTSAFSCP